MNASADEHEVYGNKNERKNEQEIPTSEDFLKDFSVTIRQEPIRGRMCGLGDTVARRMLDPPLIIQLDFNGKRQFSEQQVGEIFLRFLCYVTIHTLNHKDGKLIDATILIPNHIRSVSKGHSPYLNTLLGQRVISPLYLDDCADGEKRFFFVFSDLAIRIQGVYVLKCYVNDIVEGRTKQLQTNPFQIYPPQSYPGILEPTTLSKSLYVQGVPLRSGAYSKKISFDSSKQLDLMEDKSLSVEEDDSLPFIEDR